MVNNYPKRKPQRLKEYDYSQEGACFFTITTQDRICLFGQVINEEMVLNKFGEMLQSTWDNLPLHYFDLKLDSFVIMPNHAHGVLILQREGLKPSPTHGFTEIIRALKTFSARQINQYRQTKGTTIWQRGYYEHLVKNEEDLNRIRLYISSNPLQWALDEENPNKQG